MLSAFIGVPFSSKAESPHSEDKKDPPEREVLCKNDWMNYFPLGNIISLFASLESIMY